MKNPKEKTKSSKQWLIVLLLALISAFLIAYPYIANKTFEMATDSTVSTITKTEDDNAEAYAKEIAAAKEYNTKLTECRVSLADFSDSSKGNDLGVDYDDLLNMTKDGAMGYVEIPSIDSKLLIYHGQSDEVLKKGVGHIKGTSLPVGGLSTHSVLTGHTGLASAKLFTDLNKVEKGDIFVIDVMGQKIAYEVDQIKVVKPENTSDLNIVDGKDYCTLVTCTPYGINSHRLLVRGERTEYNEAAIEEARNTKVDTSSQWLNEYNKALLICGLLFALGLLIILMVRRKKDRKNKTDNNSSNNN